VQKSGASSILAINPETLALKSAVSVRTYVNAKVALVGESGVGKTTLAHRLIQDQFVATESTHGMNVWKLDLPVRKSDDSERKALLWDFAGQPDYRLVHQLYLEETALALLLINPQKNDPFGESIDWLKALDVAVYRAANRKVAKLLVPTSNRCWRNDGK
jgi:GTPase SAR1 family protein